MKNNKKNWYNLNSLYTLNDIATDKFISMHKVLWNNAVNRYFEESGLDKNDFRCSDQSISSKNWYDPSYLIMISRKPSLQIVNSKITTYNYSYTYDEDNNQIGLSNTFLQEHLITDDKQFDDSVTYIKQNDEFNTYNYTYVLDRENTYAYSFIRKKVYLENYWNNEFITENLSNDIDLEIKYNLNDEDELHIYTVSSIDYVNGKVILEDKLSSKKLKVNFGENVGKILKID